MPGPVGTVTFRPLGPGARGDDAVILGTGCLGERALDGQAIRQALRSTGLRQVLLVVRNGAREGDLRGAPVAGVRVGAADADEGARVAGRCRCHRLVIEPAAGTDLDGACRQLHALSRRHDGLKLLLATPDEGPLASPAALALVLEDLAALSPGYWHRPSRAALLGQGDAAWLDGLGGWLAGMSLDDVADGQPGLPPGLGTLDFAALAEWRGAAVDVALDVEPVRDVSLLRLAREQLQAKGFS
jgi:hypothetical protein